MANHASARLPWSVDQGVMELFAAEAMRAAFGGHYVPDPEEGGLAFKQRVAGAGEWSGTSVWSESGRHVEMRRNVHGLDQVAQALEFEGIVAAFGAPVAYDEGIGGYLADRPGLLRLLDFRRMCGGHSAWELRKSLGGAGKAFAQALGVDFGAGKAELDKQVRWGLRGERFESAKARLDPIFFVEPGCGVHAAGAARERYLAARRLDVLDWGSKLEWAEAVDAAGARGKGLSAAAAAGALLPSAAIGIACPKSALAKASAVGLERALSVALMWSSPLPAAQIHARLMEASSDPEASEAKAWALCGKLLARRGKVGEGEPVEGQADSAKALFESLALSRSAAKPKPGRRPAPAL